MLRSVALVEIRVMVSRVRKFRFIIWMTFLTATFVPGELIAVKAAPILFEMGGTSRALFYTMLAYASSRTNVLMRDLRPVIIILKFESVTNRRSVYSLPYFLHIVKIKLEHTYNIHNLCNISAGVL